MRLSIRTFLVAMLVWLMAGCSLGLRHDYTAVKINIPYPVTGSVAVAVLDQRSYVVSGDKPADFVGLMRGGYGNPFDVHTASRKPLADELAGIVAKGLNAAGAQTTVVATTPAANESTVQRDLLATNSARALLVTLTEWKTDAMVHGVLKFNAAVRVIDNRGKLLAAERAIGEDSLGGSFFSPGSHAASAVASQAGSHFEELLARPAIRRVLQ